MLDELFDLDDYLETELLPRAFSQELEHWINFFRAFDSIVPPLMLLSGFVLIVGSHATGEILEVSGQALQATIAQLEDQRG